MVAIGELVAAAFPSVLTFVGVIALAIWIINLVAVALTNRRLMQSRRRGLVSRILYATFLISIAILASTSFGTILRDGRMLGYPLLFHLAAAGAFVFLLLVFAAIYLPSRSPTGSDPLALGEERWWLSRWSAWLLVVSSLLAAATMFGSMLPLLGTEGLEQAATLHRYAGIAVALAALFHLTALLSVRFGWR